MRNPHPLNEIKELLDLLQEQYELLQQQQQMTRIDRDIMMDNVRRLYDVIYRTAKDVPVDVIPSIAETKHEPVLNETSVAAEEPRVAEAITDPVETAPVSEPETQETTAPVFVTTEQTELSVMETETETVTVTEIIPPAPTAQAAPAQRDEITTTVAHVTASRKKTMIATASLFDAAPSVGQTIAAKPTVYDQLGATQPDSSLGTKLQAEPVTDLKKSIGINEKFSFINELFDGDLDTYNRTVEQLNTCENLNAATALLEQTLSTQHAWNTQSTAYLNLRRLVERRYS